MKVGDLVRKKWSPSLKGVGIISRDYHDGNVAVFFPEEEGIYVVHFCMLELINGVVVE